MTHLYTVFFEFQGGIYIRQVTAVDEQEALSKWAVQLDHDKIRGFGHKTKQHLLEKVAEVKAVEAQDVINVWAFGLFFGGKYGCGTIVKTVS